MGQFRKCLIVGLFSLAGLNAGTAEEVGEPLPTFDEVITLVQQAATRRDALLEHSKGACMVRSQRGEPWGESERYEHLEPDDTGAVWPSDRIETVQWAQSGPHHRFDYTCDVKRKASSGWTILSKRISFDDSIERIYEPDIQTGFVKLPTRFGNFIQLPNTFDIDYFYGKSKVAPERLLPRLREVGYEPEIKRSLIHGIPCIYLAFYRNFPVAGGYQDKSEFLSGFHIAPALNYSLIKAVSVQQSFFKSRIRSYDVIEWLASYRESDAQPDVWLLEELTASEKRAGGGLDQPMYEKMTVLFAQTDIIDQIPQEHFTFGGLGLPEDAPIYDTRFAETPVSLVEREGGFLPHPDVQPWSMPSEMLDGNWVVAPELPRLAQEVSNLSWPQLEAQVFNRAEAHAPYPRAFRMLALNRYRKTEEQQGKARALLEHGLAMQDDVIVQGMIRPAFPSQSAKTYWADWAATAQAIVEETMDQTPERVTPLHVEALHRSITVMLPETRRLPQERPVGFEKAVRLMIRCMAHPDERVRMAAVKYLPTRNLDDPELLGEMEMALRTLLEEHTAGRIGPAWQSLARTKLDVIHTLRVFSAGD